VKTYLRIPIVALAVLATCECTAQIYRCGHGGKISYSDQSCEAGAKSTKKAYSPSTTASGTLDLQVVVTNYAVAGQDYESLLSSMNANGPKGFHGLASWKIRKDFATRVAKDGCQITAVRLTVTGEILMPRWEDKSTASVDLQRRWARYYDALKTHEDGHIQNGKELGVLVKERLMGLGTLPCKRLPEIAEREYQRIYSNLRSRDKEYDARTNHGETQGARFF
jgi:predicted secreted Zn-dependent protease